MAENLANSTQNLALNPSIVSRGDAPPNYEEATGQTRRSLPATSPTSSDPEVVKLDIGGTVFKTTKSTLMKYDGLLKVMMDAENPVAKDNSDCIFIDRSGKHFDKILNFMRDGLVELPRSEEALKEIQTEAQYYLLDGLAGMCQQEIEKMAGKIKLRSMFDADVKVLDTTGQVIQVTEKSITPVLIIYYHVDGSGKFVRPDGFYIQPFLEKHKHRVDIYFKSFSHTTRANSTGTASVSWHWSLHKRGSYLHGEPEYNENGKMKRPFESQLDFSIDKFFTKHLKLK